MERIVPTVWINEQPGLNELMDVFKAQGVKKLRINCTRHSANGYIKEILDFQKKWGNVFELILDMPIPKRKVRVFYEWKGQEVEILQGVVYSILKKDVLRKKCEGMYMEENDFNQMAHIPQGSILSIGENHAMVRLESKTDNEIFVKGICRGTVPFGKYITSSEMKFFECSENEIEEYVKVVENISCYGVALSFIENAEDVKRMRRVMNKDTRIIAKIETLEGVENLNEIIEVSDEIIIARGDLFINAGYEFFAKSCTFISTACEMKEKKYYVATGILESFRIDNMRPSRSEICEVYNIFKNTSADIVLEYSKCKTELQAVEVLNILSMIVR